MNGTRRWIAPFFVLILALIFPATALASAADAQTSTPSQPNISWAQLAKITRTNSKNRRNPPSVAISGETVVVGGALGGDGAEAYVFARSANRWTDMKLIATLRSSMKRLPGFASVATDGETVVVGKVQCEYVNACPSPGVVHIFVKPAAGWTDMTQTATLTESDATAGDFFGDSVGLSGNTVVAGAPGSNGSGGFGMGGAYVFVKPANGWSDMTETAKLTASDGTATAGFGVSVAIDGGLIAVGAPWQADGTGYLFVEPAGGWKTSTQTAEITSSAPKRFDAFGWSIAVQGDTVIAGKPGPDFFNTHGGAYVFVKPSGGWTNMTQTATLSGVNAGQDGFGYSVAFGNNFVVVGAPFNDRSDGGTVFVFPKPANGWVDASSNIRIHGSDAKHGTAFGYSLAVSGNIVAVATAPHWPYWFTPPIAAVFLFQFPANP